VAITKKARENAYIGLYKAVEKYVALQGGRVVIAEGVQVQEWPEKRVGLALKSFTIAVKCLGKKPDVAE